MQLIDCKGAIDAGLTARLNVFVGDRAMYIRAFKYKDFYWSYSVLSGFMEPYIDGSNEFGYLLNGLMFRPDLADLWQVDKLPLPTLPYAL